MPQQQAVSRLPSTLHRRATPGTMSIHGQCGRRRRPHLATLAAEERASEYMPSHHHAHYSCRKGSSILAQSEHSCQDKSALPCSDMRTGITCR